jgi:hypothetical protein
MPNGQGMLQQAAQSAGQVPPPAALQQPAPGAPAQGAPAPLAPGVAPGADPAAPPPGIAEKESPGSPVPGPQVATPGGVAPEGDFDFGEEEATPRQDKEYERALAALEHILYENDEISNSIMEQIDPNDKITTTTKASILTVNQLDDQIDLDEIVIPQITQDVVDRISELAENRYGMEYEERELQATLGATWEGVMELFGVDESDYQQLAGSFDEGQLSSLEKQHEGFLNG